MRDALSMDFLSLKFGPKHLEDIFPTPNSMLWTFKCSSMATQVPVPAPLGVRKCPEGEFPVTHGVETQQTGARRIWKKCFSRVDSEWKVKSKNIRNLEPQNLFGNPVCWHLIYFRYLQGIYTYYHLSTVNICNVKKIQTYIFELI